MHGYAITAKKEAGPARGLLHASIAPWLALLISFAAPAAETGPPPLRIMTFNVEYGGTVVDFDKVIQAIQAGDPDIVALEEPAGNTREIAWRLGWSHYSLRTDVISRHRIIDPPEGGGRFVFVEVRPGEVVAVANVHLPSDPYDPYLLQRHAPLEQMLELERTLRLPELRPFLEALVPQVRKGVPVFLLGDFNAPSHLDWTAAAVGSRSHVTRPVPWPVSMAVEAAGFSDSYRAAHPDPKARPGLTWWAPRPSTEDVYTEADPADRIDIIYSAGPAVVTDSLVIGEQGHPDVSVSVTPWPSDHRAVLSVFDVTPAPAPDMVTVNDQRLIVPGDSLRVYYWRTVPEDGEIVLTPAAATEPVLARAELCACSPLAVSTTLATDGLVPGVYAVRLRGADGRELSRTEVHARAPGASTEVSLDRAIYRVGEPLTLRWRNSPGHRWDWVAVYASPPGRAATPVRNGQRLWRYTGSAIEGEFVIGAHPQDGDAWPLPPGDYTLFYLAHDDYRPLAEARFRVIE